MEQPEIFISYSWEAESSAIADELEIAFQQKEIQIVRDKKSIGYKGLIKEFMQYLGRGKYIILIISDNYLKSPNCMFELLQIAQNGNFYDRIFPIIMADAKIFKAIDRLDYIHFWENEISELEEKIKQGSLTNLQGLIDDDLNLYSEIRRNIAQLAGILKNINTLTVKMHRESDYKELYDAISGKIEEDKHASTTENVNVAKPWQKEPSGDRKKDIEGHLSREYEMLSKFETKRDLSSDPKEVMRCEIEIEEINRKIREYEKQLVQL